MKKILFILLFIPLFAHSQMSNHRILYTQVTDVVNANVTPNTISTIPEFQVSVKAGNVYRFQAYIIYTAAAVTTGSRWTVSLPATTLCSYTSMYPLTATTNTFNSATAQNIPAACNLSSLLTNVAIIEGIFIPSATGNFNIGFASEITLSAITAKAGSTLEIW